MRLQVIASKGLSLRHIGEFKLGDEFDVPEDRHGRGIIAVLIHRKLARKVEPVIVGTPPPPPRQKAPVESTPVVQQRSVPMAPEPTSDNWAKPPWEEAKADSPPPEPDEMVVLEEDTAEPTEGDVPRRRGRPPIHGRYARRDLRSED